MSWFGSSSRKTTIFYVVLIAMASLVVGMVIASRLDLSPASSAQTMAIPATNTRPLAGPVDADHVPQHRQGAVADGREHPHRVAAADAGPERVLWRRRSLRTVFRRPGHGRTESGSARAGTATAAAAPAAAARTHTQAAGSGFIISKDGFILTNNHVVEGASKIEVQFFDDEDEEYYEAKVIGRDPLTDSALIQLVEKPTRDLPVAKFGDSSSDGARRLGDGHRQPVRPCAHGQRRRGQRDGTKCVRLHSWAPPAADSDRCGDQSGQLGRPAV